jgi:hypothetical protein|nr:MAG TPA: helix-turn-helix domain protein [Caudoviricetes sp.]
MEFGQQLKTIRKEKGMTQVQLAKFLDVSEASVRNWEQGVSKPNRTCRQILKDKLGIDYSPAVQRKNNFYHLKARLKQYQNEPMLPIYKSKYLDQLLGHLKWAMVTENTENEMRLIGAITRQLMQHCFKRNFEFEACLAKAMECLKNRGEENKDE